MDLSDAAAIFRNTADSALFVTSQLRPRELKMAEGLRRLGWRVGLIYYKWTPFEPEAYFDFSLEAGSAKEAHRFAMGLAPRVSHVFSGAIDDLVLMFCRDKPSPVVIDLNDVFAPSLFDYCHERFEPTQEALALAEGFCARDLQVKSAERTDHFRLPPKLLLFPEYCWNTIHAQKPSADTAQSDEVHVVSVGTFSLETQGMHDSCYLRLTQLLLDQKIHFHIYPHWDYRRDHLGSPHVNFERDFAEFLAIEKRNPYLHLHDSLPIDELGKVLPQYDFGIVSGGCADFGQKLKYYHPAYLETCYSGRISDYLDARLPVLINDEVKFDYWLLKRHGACVDLKGVLRPGFKQHLLELKQDGRQREIMERAAKKLSVDFNSPRLVSFYKAIIAAGTLGQSSEVHDADGSQFSESLTTSSASAKAPEPMFQDGVGTRLMIKLSDAVRWASPRAAKILLPYRAIRIFQVRLHNALQENELNHSLIANLRSQLSDLVQDHLAVTTKLASLLQEHSSACLQASAREQDNAALRARVVDLQQDHSALLTLSASLQTENESFRKANTGNQCQFESLQQEHAVLRSQCNELQQNNDVLQTLVRNLKDEVGALTQQVHVLSNEKFILQQEAQWGKLPINEIAGVLNWPEVLNDVERANGFTDLIRILGLFSGGANRPDSPSACWNLLATKNYDQLLTSGYNNFKRTVGTNYFNFLVQKGDPQIQAVESLLSVETIARCRSAALSIPEDRLLPCPDQFSYNYFVLLLWEYVKTLDVARHIDKLGEPEEGNPILVRSGERSVSQDLANSLIEYYAISESVSFAQIGTVLEIGGGYGRNAYVILALNPGIRVTMVDIPPALYLAQRYLSSVFKGRRVFKARNFSNYDEVKDELEAASIVFLMPHQLAFMPKGIFDLSMNISSFGEMSNEQIQWYFPQIGRVTGQYFYMKQWRTSSNVFDGTVLQESDYPYPKNWRQIYSRPGRVQTEFFEALYQVTKT